MTFDSTRAMIEKNRRPIVLSVLALCAIALYFLYLTRQNERAQAFVADLQARDPTLYLDELRRLEGFDAFLSAYRDLRGFGEFTPQAPPFLTGRWTMKQEQVRVPPDSSFALCSNPLLIDYGHITLTGEESRTAEARYRLTPDGRVEIETDRFGTIPVRIVAYGPQINFLEFTPPGSTDPVNAYRCTI